MYLIVDVDYMLLVQKNGVPINHGKQNTTTGWTHDHTVSATTPSFHRAIPYNAKRWLIPSTMQLIKSQSESQTKEPP
jgi:hypothetical protein